MDVMEYEKYTNTNTNLQQSTYLQQNLLASFNIPVNHERLYSTSDVAPSA
jgi:hypothetical protein